MTGEVVEEKKPRNTGNPRFHTLLIDNSSRHRLYFLLLLSHVDVDGGVLREQAAKYGPENEIGALLRYRETHGEVDDDRLPEWDEFQELAADYCCLEKYLVQSNTVGAHEMPAPVSKDDLVVALKSLAADLGRPPTRADMETEGVYSATPYYRQFGSWPAALEHANLDPQYRQEIPDDELLAALTDLADELGRSPRAREMDTQGPFSPSTYRRRFGSWTDALVQAELSPATQADPTQIERTELLIDLFRLTHKLGRPPTQTDVETDGAYSVDVYHDRFGSWTAALEEANLRLE